MAGELIEVLEEWDDQLALHLFERLRAADLREIAATRGACDPVGLFIDWRLAWPNMLARGILLPDRCMYGTSRSWGALAIFGVVPTTPGVGQACLLATDDLTRRQTRSLVHLLRRHWEPAVRRESGLHRIEALSIEGHESAHRLLQALGCTRTGIRTAMGRNGEDFHEFTWLNHDLIRERRENARCA